MKQFIRPGTKNGSVWSSLMKPLSSSNFRNNISNSNSICLQSHVDFIIAWLTELAKSKNLDF